MYQMLSTAEDHNILPSIHDMDHFHQDSQLVFEDCLEYEMQIHLLLLVLVQILLSNTIFDNYQTANKRKVVHEQLIHYRLTVTNRKKKRSQFTLVSLVVSEDLDYVDDNRNSTPIT